MNRPRLCRRTGVARPILAAHAVVSLCACAGIRTGPTAVPSPAELPALEASLRTDSTDLDLVARLVMGYVADGRLAEAHGLLAQTQDLSPLDHGHQLMSALIAEELGQRDVAADAYRSYLASSTGPFRGLAAARLEGVLSEALRIEYAAQPDASREPALDRRWIAVVPFASTPDLADLADGLRWSLGRALERGPYRLLDRRIVRAVLDAAGNVGPTDLSVVESLVRQTGAANVVIGTVRPSPDGVQVLWDLTVVSVVTHELYELASLPTVGTPSDLLTLIPRVAAAIPLAARGRPIVDARAPELSGPGEVAALEAFARGVRLTETDEWSASIAAFDEALALEPDFSDARAWRERADAVSRAQALPLPEGIVEIARAAQLERSVAVFRAGPTSAPHDARSPIGGESSTAPAEALGFDFIGASLPVLLLLTPTSSIQP